MKILYYPRATAIPQTCAAPASLRTRALSSIVEPVVKTSSTNKIFPFAISSLFWQKNVPLIFLSLSSFFKSTWLKERGFNQSEEIAKELSKILEIPALNDVLIKTKQTFNQVDLKKEERERNIKGAFFCQKRELIANRKILLVDDVFTTGSTMEESARILKEAGAAQVWGITVARG